MFRARRKLEHIVDLERQNTFDQGGGGDATHRNSSVENIKHGYFLSPEQEKMSVCFETNNMLASPVSTTDTTISEDVSVNCTTAPTVQSNCDLPHPEVANPQVPKSTAKLVVANHPPTASAGNTVLQKVVNPPLITVLNSSGPLTVVKTLCVTSGASSAPQFTVVNSAPLNVTNTGKSPTITLLNGPLTVVKAIPGMQHATTTEKAIQEAQCNNPSVQTGHQPVPAIIENRTHNVFVKNTCSDVEIPQSHKLLTANNFPQSNLLNLSQPTSKVNGQRSKLKILSNVMASTSQMPTNLILNKPSTTNQQRYMPPHQSRPKVIGPNGATTTKYINKPSPNTAITKMPPTAVRTEKSPQRVVYPTHKGHLKTLPPVPNYMHKQPQGIKILPPQTKPFPGQMQRTGSGLKTIPAQKPPKTPKAPNYLNKHPVQPQKMKYPPTKLKPLKTSAMPYMQLPDKQLTFNQVLTAEILETLGNKTSPSSSYSYKNFEPITNRYESSYCYEKPAPAFETPKPVEEKSKALDALSLICQAVLLDHNYNATLPPESPTRSIPQQPPQVNGVTSSSIYSPGVKRRSFSSSNTVSASSSMTNLSLLPGNSTVVTPADDDAASDVSFGSDRKQDTEGEETDTAPEAEMVNNGEDHYGDYVTRCICGFIHDDGYMIECDRCKVWQHVQCVIKNKQVPDEYLCEVCDPSKHVDRQKAKMMQQQWLRDRQFPELRKNKETKLKEVMKHREALSDSDSSDQEQGDESERLSQKEMKFFSKTHCSVPECESVKSKSVSLFRFPPSKTLCQRWARALKIGKKITKYMLVCSLHFKETDFHPNTPNRLRKRLKPNVVPSQNLPARKNTIEKKESGRGPNTIINKARAPLARRKIDPQQKQLPKQRREPAKEANLRKPVKRRERKVMKRKVTQPKIQPKPQSEEDIQETLQMTHLPQLRQWIENYEEAVTNHYSPELRARISSIRVNGAHSDLSVQFDSSVEKCRVNTQPLTEMRYLVTTMYLSPNTYVIELRGKYMLSTQHRNFGGATTTRQHAQRPGPFLFFYRLHKDNTEVCVDTRTYGNSARFIRRSCKPNAELRHCIEKGVLHLYIVTITSVEKNAELTIKHESHDLAAIGTTFIACACGNADECTVNRPVIKKNGENIEINQRKRRGRRAVSLSVPPTVTSEIQEIPPKIEREPSPPPEPTPVVSPPVEVPMPPAVVEIKEEPKEIIKEELKPQPEIKIEVEEPKPEPKQEEEDEDLKPVKMEVVPEDEEKPPPPVESPCKEEDIKPPQPPVSTRRASHNKVEHDEHKEQPPEPKEDKIKNKKLSREERKLEAILRAIEQMEKADQRKQEHQAKQAHRRESEPGPNCKDDDKSEPKVKRRRRKGRTRTVSSNASSRRNRFNSTDSYLTSGDESLMSPNEGQAPSNVRDGDKTCENKELSATPHRDDIKQCEKSPVRDDSNNSNSAHSSPETHLSSACLLVQAAVEPLEQGFKFPKTKKGLMNEWLNKAPESVQSPSSISPPSLTPHISMSSDYESSSSYNSTSKCLGSISHNNFSDNIQSHGNAKKRWLRQAISEDQCDSPTSRPESPPMTDAVAPPKKRRLPRESLSNEESPVTTPTNGGLLLGNKLEGDKQEGCVEIVYSAEGDSPTQTLESDAILKERAAEMKQEFSSCIHSSIEEQANQQLNALSCLMDPRLSREHNNQMFCNSEHLVGTVEKTLSILGFEDRKPEPITPAKRKLSITEYRQRKKQNTNEIDKIVEEPTSTEDNNSLESFKPCRQRSDSTSSTTSLSSDEDSMITDMPGKASAFNSEPTELERQREISRLRLKKAFGLSLDDEPFKPSLKAIINCELPPVVKPSVPLSSPTFPIPGSLIPGSINSASPKSIFSENSLSSQPSPVKNASAGELEKAVEPSPKIDESMETDLKPATSPISEDEMSPLVQDQDDEDENVLPSPISEENEKTLSVKESSEQAEQPDEEPEKKSPELKEEISTAEEPENGVVEPTMFYTPDEEEAETPGASSEVESMSYVPPFNNPIYPNTGFSTYTSVIDNDARYEGRNPSPPPDLDQASSFNDHQS